MLSPTDVLAIHRPTARLTERGVAVVAVYRLLAQLRDLDAEDRRDVRELLEMELGEQLA